MTDGVYRQMSAQREQRTGGELIAPATNDLTGQLQTHRQTKRLEKNTHTHTYREVLVRIGIHTPSNVKPQRNVSLKKTSEDFKA